jgi:two-component system, NtrC family, response regulator GlrR
MVDDGSTQIVDGGGGLTAISVPRFQLQVTAGPDAGKSAVAIDGNLTVGTADGATLKITDPTVSRFHAELQATPQGITIRDLGSTNGTMLGAAQVREIVVRSPVDLAFGRTFARLTLGVERVQIAASRSGTFGALIGRSAAMRAVYTVLERAAPTTAPVLLTGESGTGKELAARAVHAASARSAAAFEVVDCGGLPTTLIESELFGHERGAFTGATGDREGAFERADGGTLFLDELGELPLELQPKLLRALGEGEIRRVGARKTRKIDVRVVAATNRDLRRQVNAGQFRADLYYRLAVIEVRMPPLRDRLDDLALLVPALLETITRARGLHAHVEPNADLLATLARHAWPGNVRELRNYLEQMVILQVEPTIAEGASSQAGPDGALSEGLIEMPLRLAKSELLERFERRYVSQMLEQTSGNVAEAARRAGVDRGTLFRTIRRHGLRAGDP